ncbi:MAG: glycosyltransferase [Mangrovibacterium sp.]
MQRYLSLQTQPFIAEKPSDDLFLSVVIPAHNEPDLLRCIDSLAACHMTKHDVEVIVVVNESEGTPPEVLKQNARSLHQLEEWKQNHQQAPFKLHSIHPAPFRHKFRGVGSARKAGMDEVIHRYHSINQPQGIIISLDADTLVEPNYLTAIETHFLQNPHSIGCTIDFKHRIDELDNVHQKEGMQRYEQYLHDFKNSLQLTGYPHAIHTIGSAFACRANAYAKQGGMPRRQAGEDFYFLHKLTNMGKLSELHETCVYPSARVSDRVPFGTGPSIQRWLDGDNSIGMNYNRQAFLDLRDFFASMPELHHAQTTTKYTEILNLFLDVDNFWTQMLPQLQRNSGSFQSFEKHFFQYFNTFKIIQFLNFCHPNPYSYQESPSAPKGVS